MVADAYKAPESAVKAGVVFLQSEVLAGITFADLALNSDDKNKRFRNTANAMTAYESAIHFMDRVPFTESQARDFAHKIDELRRKLAELGEHV